MTGGAARMELIDFTIERQRHRRFVGREDVLAQLDEWLLGSDEAGWVVVTRRSGDGQERRPVCVTDAARGCGTPRCRTTSPLSGLSTGISPSGLRVDR